MYNLETLLKDKVDEITFIQKHYRNVNSRIVFTRETVLKTAKASLPKFVKNLVVPIAQSSVAKKSVIPRDVSHKIVDIFEHFLRISPTLFCELKHRISEEESDFLDLTDLIEDLEVSARSRFVNDLCARAAANSHLIPDSYKTLVISDLDNTCIENAMFGFPDSGVAHKEILPGFVDVVKALTADFTTTATFISARPRQFEKGSIAATEKVLSKSGIKRFAFASGELHAPARYGASMIVGNRNRKLLTSACIDFAALKYQCYLKLKELFPECCFAFLGDDTQGDAIFATAMTAHSPSVAFIRKAAPPGEGVLPGKQGWPSPVELISSPPLAPFGCPPVSKLFKEIASVRFSDIIHGGGGAVRSVSIHGPQEGVVFTHSSYADVLSFIENKQMEYA